MNLHVGQPAVDSAMPPTIADHELFHPIASGSYGEVWLARNAVGTPRAVKIVRRDRHASTESFDREFKGLQKFEPVSRAHEGLVDILTLGRLPDDAGFYYVMELADQAELGPNPVTADVRRLTSVPTATDANRKKEQSEPPHVGCYEARTLRHDLKLHGHLPVADCIQLGLKLTDALAHLHAQGLVHRDVKPSNILFIGGEPKLADAGLVAAVDDARSLVGTTGYIAPEGPGTPQADLYALGKVLYETAFGKDRQDFPQLPPGLRSRPDHARLLELNEVILKACETDPRRRYATAASLAADLTALQRGQSVKRRRLWQRRLNFAKIPGAAAVVILAVAFTVSVMERAGRGHIPKPEALDLYKEGQWQYNQLTPEAHVKALNFLTQAVQVDPEFVQPYGELMALYTWLMIPGITNEQLRLQRVREIADKALAIDPNAAEGHTALSWCRFLERDWRGAEDEIQRAIGISPNFALAHDIYCFYLSMQGRTQEAHREGELAVKLEPPNSRRATAIIASWPFITERRFDLATVKLKRVLEQDPNFSSGHGYLAQVYECQSNYSSAIDEYKAHAQLVGLDPARVAAAYGTLRQAYDTQGDQGYLRKKIELIHADLLLPEDQQIFGQSADGYYARLGEKEKALDELETHFDEPQFWHQLKFDPLYDNLHDEPRFKELLKRAHLEK